MPNDGKNLQATLREVIGETVTDSKAAHSETKEGSTTGSATETKTGEPVREYVSGIDISDIPEQDRPRIKEMFSKKAKLLEDGYNDKFKKVAELVKTQEALEKSGLTVDEARDVLVKHLEGKKAGQTQADAKKQNLRTLDRLIDASTDADQKAALQQMRTIVEEETGIKSIQEKLDRLEKFYQGSMNEKANARQVQLESEIKELGEKYGSEFVGKYKDFIVKEGLQYQNSSAKRLLLAIADPEEIEQAILSQKTNGKKQLTEDKLNAISSGGSGITGSQENLDTKKMSIKDVLKAVIPNAGKK